MKLNQSPVTQHQFDGLSFHLKRDDQLHPLFSGNKARKFSALLNPKLDESVHAIPENIDTLISYGSVQANSLYSLAGLAKIKGWKLEYYVHNIPSWLKAQPIGNYRGALELDAQVISVKELDNAIHPREFIDRIRKPTDNCLVIPEGGRSTHSESGIKQLAIELLEYIQMQSNSHFTVALPSGTGTTALYLHKYLKPYNIEVVTCACVGGKQYLIEQFQELGETDFPTIIKLEDKHHFGRLYKEDYEIWAALEAQTHVEFDLLYDPLMWRCIKSWASQNLKGELLYVHQGGILGNESMLLRYQREFGVESTW
ncbi:1-aminocyclopropane-1-carboxylate deaminase/D-cysteine desulfhydrase [Vibrio agarivorans]|uniref:1-aminocyclopropane-1-carboxylate deaminase/D-cysteine desulfhydrase n=1 Tax=Vibrio agarivorans TaxID=153622 RepID=UPI0022300047|nr:1-aminocyclopropane-1-carboxylate deaminase/D-cysteine desulfhydrase [Vibrio agarivorans]MDN3663109.1 1-aminocyclopropane-1-carboxylate deaminase/D-cysteine desulfhydrase [Vibrio agarivorans]